MCANSVPNSGKRAKTALNPYAIRPSRLQCAKYNLSGDYQLNFSADIWTANNTEPAANPNRSLLHPRKTEMSWSAVCGNVFGYSLPVVPQPHCEVASVAERDLQLTPLRMQESISNRF